MVANNSSFGGMGYRDRFAHQNSMSNDFQSQHQAPPPSSERSQFVRTSPGPIGPPSRAANNGEQPPPGVSGGRGLYGLREPLLNYGGNSNSDHNSAGLWAPLGAPDPAGEAGDFFSRRRETPSEFSHPPDSMEPPFKRKNQLW